MSIFVNPAQFAPHEDLATYPRTLPRDLEILEAQSVSVRSVHSSDPSIRKPSAVFLPSVQEMYPSGINQDPAAQKGTFIEVKGYGDQMEGKSRPTFFRGVATVVTKLFNAIEVHFPVLPLLTAVDLVPSPPTRISGKKTSSNALF
jgi:pantoate--beta-alanine ligase